MAMWPIFTRSGPRTEKRTQLKLERATRAKQHRATADTTRALQAATHAELLASIPKKARRRLAPYFAMGGA